MTTSTITFYPFYMRGMRNQEGQQYLSQEDLVAWLNSIEMQAKAVQANDDVIVIITEIRRQIEISEAVT